jgi:hypothetical protein
VLRILSAILVLLIDRLRVLGAFAQGAMSLKAENLFLRAQLALYVEREARPAWATHLTRLRLVALSRLRDWRGALVVVKPRTLLRWHRAGFRLLWRWRSRSGGRPPLPGELCRLIAGMVRDNPSRGEERIAAELRLKLGLRVSPRTVRRCWPASPGRWTGSRDDQRWATFVKNHAHEIVACDFLTVVTAVPEAGRGLGTTRGGF